jgi:hypothetical protein
MDNGNTDRSKLTIDERLEKLEFLLAGHIEQAKKDYEENRRLWRDQQTDIAAIWTRMERGFQETKERFEESRKSFDAGMAAMREEMAGRDRITDKRIGALVSAIGELIKTRDETKTR